MISHDTPKYKGYWQITKKIKINVITYVLQNEQLEHN